MQAWTFRYDNPVVTGVVGVLPTTGGEVTVLGYNFGQTTAPVRGLCSQLPGSPG